MKQVTYKIYLSGEIHSRWRDNIKIKCEREKLPTTFYYPVTDHSLSDDCAVNILGKEEKKFWHDYKGASMNNIRISSLIKKSDLVIIRFGEKYKQWNAAFDAGMASSLGKPIITYHDDTLDHALKEIDAVANIVCRTENQIVKSLKYIIEGTI